MVDIIQRYYPAVKLYNSFSGKNILDIGCGNLGGIVPFVNLDRNKITLCDEELGKFRKLNINYCKSSILDIPFPDNYFDLTLCMDVLEHLPKKLRGKAAMEMLRVTNSKLLISFPEGESSSKYDLIIKNLYEKMTGRPQHFLREHEKYGLPEATDVLAPINKSNIKVRIKSHKEVNIKIWIISVILSQIIAYIPIKIDSYNLIKKHSLSFFTLKYLYVAFGWITPFLSFGKTYRMFIEIEKA